MSQPRKRRQPEEQPTKKVLGVRVPAGLNDQLEAMARRENNGVSTIVRRLLTEALRNAAAAS